jgi:hypothetical protein
MQLLASDFCGYHAAITGFCFVDAILASIKLSRWEALLKRLNTEDTGSTGFLVPALSAFFEL